MKIRRCLSIHDDALNERLWQFYHQMFQELNERTPFAQSFDRNHFNCWLKSEDAVKLYAVNIQEEIVAFAVVSKDLDHDPLISKEYFAKQYPDKTIYHFPAIAIHGKARASLSGMKLMKAMTAEIREPDAICLYFHSEWHNPGMSRLITIALEGKTWVAKADAMACQICWKTDKDLNRF